MTTPVQRALSVAAAILALGALAASLGLHPRLAAEAALTTATLVLVGGALVRIPRTQQRRRRPAPAEAADRFQRSRDAVLAALETDWGVQTQLVPAVREIVASRLSTTRGVSLAEDPVAARAQLHPDVANLLADHRPPRSGIPGLTAAEIDRLLAHLEEM